MATDSTIFQIVNASAPLVNFGNKIIPETPSSSTQMDIWSFPYVVPPMNFVNFPVKFHTGTGDQNDSGQQGLWIDGFNALTLVASSSNTSQHSLTVQKPSVGTQTLGTNMVLGICAHNTILNALLANEIIWYGYDGLAGPWNSQPLAMNDTFMGIAVVDVTAIGLTSAVSAILLTGIANNYLTYVQAQQLQQAIVNTILSPT